MHRWACSTEKRLFACNGFSLNFAKLGVKLFY
jgi:hypothetical protein